MKALITSKINTDFSSCDFYEKIKSNEDFLQKVLSTSTEKYDWPNMQIYKCLNIVLFLSKMHHFNFFGASTTGIQNDYMLSNM